VKVIERLKDVIAPRLLAKMEFDLGVDRYGPGLGNGQQGRAAALTKIIREMQNRTNR
jgi:hypothetical protein